MFCDDDESNDDDESDDEVADESDDEAAHESDDDDRSSCLDVRVCHHVSKRFKGGLPFLEFFKVKLKYNDELSTNELFKDACLYGEIVTEVPKHYPYCRCHDDEDNLVPISFYRVSPFDPDLILNLHSSDRNKSILLPISGPKPRPILYDYNHVCFRFALKVDGEDIFNNGLPHVNPPLFRNDKPTKAGAFSWDPNKWNYEDYDFGPYTRASKIGFSGSDRILCSARYAIYRGSCGTVEVKMLKELGGGFYGAIVARPCVFYSRIRLLTIQRDCEIKKKKKKPIMIQRDGMGVVESGGRIKLTRSMVAVTIYSSLIIGAELYDIDDEELICRGRAAFAAKESGEETKYISYKGVRGLEVRVQWRCDYEFQNKEFVKGVWKIS